MVEYWGTCLAMTCVASFIEVNYVASSICLWYFLMDKIAFHGITFMIPWIPAVWTSWISDIHCCFEHSWCFLIGRDKRFFFERGTLLISRCYIEMIQHLENDPGLCLKSTWPKVSPTQSQTLVTINPMTRLPPMRLGENILGHLLQEPRGHNKRLLRSRLLKGSPSAQPVRSPVEYLQKRGMFVFKYRSISAEPDRPA